MHPKRSVIMWGNIDIGGGGGPRTPPALPFVSALLCVCPTMHACPTTRVCPTVTISYHDKKGSQNWARRRPKAVSFVRSFVRMLLRLIVRFIFPLFLSFFVCSFVCPFVRFFLRFSLLLLLLVAVCFHFLSLEIDVNIVRHRRKVVVNDMEKHSN